MQARKPCVKAVGSDERCVRSLLDDSPLFHDENTVARQHCCKAMRDDNRGAISHQVFECGLHQRFALGIQRRRCFVEEQ